MTFLEWVKSRKRYNQLLKKLYSKPDFEKYRQISYDDFVTQIDTHVFSYPRLGHVPKDDGSKREIFIYDTLDNLILKLLNEYLIETRSELLSPNVYSYMSGVSVAKIIDKFTAIYNPNKTYMKIDLTNYFMTPSGGCLQSFLEAIGLDDDYYAPLFQNKYYIEDELHEKNLGLLPGAPISAFLSNAYLHDFDIEMEEISSTYFRYSDDFIIACDKYSPEETATRIRRELNKLGLVVNERKVTIYRPNDTITFLGVDIDSTGTRISRRRFVELKKRVKSYAKQSRKHRGSSIDKVEHFMSSLYRWLLMPITTNYRRGATIQSWFSVTSTADLIREIDFYILDQARFVYSGKHNQGALASGIDTAWLEEHGFFSLVKLWGIYKKSPLEMGLVGFLHRKQFYLGNVVESDIDANTYVLHDILELAMSLESDKYLNHLCIDCYSKQVSSHGRLVLSDTKALGTFWNGTEFITLSLQDDYGSIEESVFIKFWNQLSYKSLATNKRGSHPIYNPVPPTALPYYAYLNSSKSSVAHIVATLLFLYSTGRLQINFSKATKQLIRVELPTVKFLFPNPNYCATK